MCRDATLWKEIGNLYALMQAWEQAIDAYAHALEIEPQNAEFYRLIATIYERIGNVERAHELEACAAKMSAQSQMTPRTAQTAQALDVPAQAVISGASIHKADVDKRSATTVSVNPVPAASLPSASLASRRLRAMLAGQPGTEVMLAEQSEDKAAPSAPEPKLLAENLRPVRKKYSLEEQIRIYQRLIEENPTNEKAWNALGVFYWRAGRLQDAIQSFEKALELSPNSPGIHFNLGGAYAAIGEDQRAIHHYMASKDYVNMAAVYSGIAGAYRRLGNNEQAQHWLVKASLYIGRMSAYDRACYEAIRGDAWQAVHYLRLAFEQQQVTLAQILNDPDLSLVQNTPAFRHFLDDIDLQRKKDGSLV